MDIKWVIMVFLINSLSYKIAPLSISSRQEPLEHILCIIKWEQFPIQIHINHHNLIWNCKGNYFQNLQKIYATLQHYVCVYHPVLPGHPCPILFCRVGHSCIRVGLQVVFGVSQIFLPNRMPRQESDSDTRTRVHVTQVLSNKQFIKRYSHCMFWNRFPQTQYNETRSIFN